MNVPLIVDKLDPARSTYIRRFMKIAGLIQHTTKMFVTSSDWEAIIAELEAQYRPMLMDPTAPAPWGNNRPMQFGTKEPLLYVINSGTEDQGMCNYMNEESARQGHVAESVQKLRSSINA